MRARAATMAPGASSGGSFDPELQYRPAGEQLPGALPEQLLGSAEDKPDGDLERDHQSSMLRSGSNSELQQTANQRKTAAKAKTRLDRSITIGAGSRRQLLDELASEGVQAGEDVTWLHDAHKAHPYMLATEIQGLNTLFLSFARHDQSGRQVIVMEAVKKMMDAALKDLYNKIDSDGSGCLSRGEIAALIGNLGEPLPPDELTEVMNELDRDGSGEVDYGEFKNWWHKQQYPSEEDYDRELMDLFSAVDADGSGVIDWDEFLEMIGYAHR